MKNIFEKTLHRIVEFIFGLEENPSQQIENVKNILVVRQHNQLGDLLAGTPLFRALKERYPESNLTCIVSPANADAVVKNRFIDEIFIFDKNKLLSVRYLISLKNILSKKYDIAVVPVVVSISFTSNLIARISNSRVRIGARSLEGKTNKSKYLFDRLIDLDWRTQPDLHVAEKILSIVKPFGINTNNFGIEISFDSDDKMIAEKFINENIENKRAKLIGIHAGAGKPPNRWAKERFLSLINFLKEKYSVNIFLTASDADEKIISYLKEENNFPLPVFKNKSIPQVAALCDSCDLFITNDTGVMHIAGATSCKQISLFGPTNPFNWAPIGKNKMFIRKSDLIDDISLNDVIKMVDYLCDDEHE